MSDPFRAQLDELVTAKRYPLKKVLPFYVVMFLFGAACIWLIRDRWTFMITPPVYEQAQLIGFGTNGRAGPIARVKTKDGRLILLPAGSSGLSRCRVGAPVRLERRGESLALAHPACPR